MLKALREENDFHTPLFHSVIIYILPHLEKRFQEG